MRTRFLLAAALLAVAAISPAQPGVAAPDTGAKKVGDCYPACAINSFDRLIEVLSTGGQVRAVFHYARCRLVMDGDTIQAPDAIGGMDLANFEYFAPKSVGNEMAFVSSSQTALIARRKGHVYNYVKLKLYQDGRAEITARYLEPPKMKVRMDELFLGRLNDGLNQGGVTLFQFNACRPCSCWQR